MCDDVDAEWTKKKDDARSTKGTAREIRGGTVMWKLAQVGDSCLDEWIGFMLG